MQTILRDMDVTDIDQVTYIENASFPTSWSTLTYIYEIKQNPTTFMGVLEVPQQVPSREARPPMDRLQLIARSLMGQRHPSSEIVAYGGVWVKLGEAHISTIASHQDYRGMGLGELMLVGMIARGIAEGATHSVLEVRVSNVIAQNLYRKYGYQQVRVLKQYYHDNKEDAFLMRIPRLDEQYLPVFRKNVESLTERITFEDQFSGLELEKLEL